METSQLLQSQSTSRAWSHCISYPQPCTRRASRRGDVDSSGTLLRKYKFNNIVSFKESIVKEDRRFAKAFTAHLLRFALARELRPVDTLTIDAIVNQTETEDFKLKSLIREVILSDSFLRLN